MVFLEEGDPLFRPDDETIVDTLAMASAVRQVGKKDGVQRRRILDNEPILGPYLQHEILKLVGRLALSGATPSVVRGVVGDIYRMVDTAGSALREGYRSMLADLLPADDDLPDGEHRALAREEWEKREEVE